MSLLSFYLHKALQSCKNNASFKILNGHFNVKVCSLEKHVLVTGGAGFLGSHLVDRLIDRGDKVIVVDNFFTGLKENLSHLHNHPNIEVIRHDINFPLYIEVQEIWNLACPASPVSYQNDPVQTIKTSINGAMNMLGLAKRTGAKIFQASTSEVYGDPLVSPQAEEYQGNVNPIGVRSCYDEGKRAAETLFFDYRRQHGLDIRVARIFNTYGPRMHLNDGRVVCNFIVQALRNEHITIYGDGTQTRSFCYVDDLIQGFIKFMELDGYEGGPINLGNPDEMTIMELAVLIKEITNSSSEIIYKDLPSDDPLQRCPDITKAKNTLDWEPKINLMEGLERTISYFRSEI